MDRPVLRRRLKSYTLKDLKALTWYDYLVNEVQQEKRNSKATLKQIFPRFHQPMIDLMYNCEQIINEYQPLVGALTVRQIYYQLLSRGLISAEDDKNVGKALLRTREVGYISWDSIIDNVRYRMRPHRIMDICEKPSPEQEIDLKIKRALNPDAAKHYQFSRWYNQPYYVELWVEKDAIAAFFDRSIRKEYQVLVEVCKGRISSTNKYNAAMRFEELRYLTDGEIEIIILYYGDHDPTGLDAFYKYEKFFEGQADFIRLGIDYPKDIEEFDLEDKGLPLKGDDNLKKWYIEETGCSERWEIDALPPERMVARVRDRIDDLFDQNIHNELQEIEADWCERYRKRAQELSNHPTNPNQTESEG
jgi:hypothetical protein